MNAKDRYNAKHYRSITIRFSNDDKIFGLIDEITSKSKLSKNEILVRWMRRAVHYEMTKNERQETANTESNVKLYLFWVGIGLVAGIALGKFWF